MMSDEKTSSPASFRPPDNNMFIHLAMSFAVDVISPYAYFGSVTILLLISIKIRYTRKCVEQSKRFLKITSNKENIAF